MGTPKNPKPNKEKKGKMGGYESISSMNHFKFMEIDDHINFLYLNCFVALHKYNHSKHYILQPFMFALY
jgi:hypothetical protein